MSHYVVMVVGDDPEDQLEPFSEHIEMPRYVKKPVSDEDKEQFMDYYRKNEEITEDMSFEQMYGIYGDRWNANVWKEIDGTWYETSTYNPNSKWDWYELGGRWRNFLQLKDGGVADQALKGEIEGFNELEVFAILKDGEWLEKGEMGWFGVSHNNLERNEWLVKRDELCNSIPDDAVISIYDCHI